MKVTCPVCTFQHDADKPCPSCAQADKVAGPRPMPVQPPQNPEDAFAARMQAGVRNVEAEAETGGVEEAPKVAGAGRATSAPPPPSPPASGDDRPDDITDAELTALAKGDSFVVCLLGFPTAGKTFFLNRLKKVCLEGRRMSVMPGPADTGEMGGTYNVSAHRFALPGRPGFTVIDLPGERFLNAVKDNFAQDTKLLHAASCSDALVIMLPVDEALFAARAERRYGRPGEDGQSVAVTQETARQQRLAEVEQQMANLKRTLRDLRTRAAEDGLAEGIAAAETELKAANKEAAALKKAASRNVRVALAATEARLGRFIDGIGKLVGVLSLRDQNRFGPYTDAVVADHLGDSTGFRPCARPTFVALAKADLLDQPDKVISDLLSTAELEDLADYDRDPLHMVRTFRPSLADQFETWFQWSKTDFVGAFVGQKEGRFMDYGLPHRGVDAVIDWILWASRSPTWPAARWRELASARWIRGLVDPRPQPGRAFDEGRKVQRA